MTKRNRNILIAAIIVIILLTATVLIVWNSYLAKAEKNRQKAAEENESKGITSTLMDASETDADKDLASQGDASEATILDASTENMASLGDASKADQDSENAGQQAFVNKGDIQVKDTVAPQLLICNAEPKVKQWSEFDIHKFLGYADNQDERPVLEVTGQVDTSTLGTYPITFTVTDASGNVTEGKMNVQVLSNLPKDERVLPDPTFQEFIAKYPGENLHYGIDVSVWQGDINFEKVKAAGCEFVIMRIAHYEGGTLELDKCFKQNLQRATAAGLKVGIYFYTTDYDEDMLRQHISWLLDQLGDYKLNLPVAYDWEKFSAIEDYHMSLQDMNDLYAAFADECAKRGYDAMLYSSKNFLTNVWMNDDNHWRDGALNELAPYNSKDTTVWLAHYTEQTDYTGRYWIWQQGYGHIDGISELTDFNVMYGDYK